MSQADRIAYLEALEEKRHLQETLPHLYRWKNYKWSEEFLNSRNRMTLLVAANQISKTSTQIRKVITWATDKSLWPELWPTTPQQFWYLYPSKDIATIEFENKWVPEFLPTDKNDSVYGWKEEMKGGNIFAIHFKSGVSLYFKTYAQNLQTLQAGSCHYVATDEELPEEIYPELSMRIAATEGYFSMVFTATLGQDFWREAMEIKGEGERFPQALKIHASMYDCLTYTDGTPSRWTLEKIQRLENQCATKAEVARRIYGRFVVSEGRKFPSFVRERNMKKPQEAPPRDWYVYGGVDVGSGGESGHPGAICFVAVNQEFTKARVFRGWRGDGVVTTAGDMVDKFVELRGFRRCMGQFYDWHSKDFFTIASRQGESFQPAEKSHEIGENMLNTLFKNEMLLIDDIEELIPLGQELQNLQASTAKTRAKDDYCDALRYTVSKIPWDWSAIASDAPTEPVEEKESSEMQERRKYVLSEEEAAQVQEQSIEQEFDEWNSMYEG